MKITNLSLLRLISFSLFVAYGISAWASPGDTQSQDDNPLNFVMRGRPGPTDSAKIFLVAGGQESVSFPQEIIDLKKFWMSRGYREDEIACYYTQPLPRNADLAKEQYRNLIPELSHCYPADPKIFRMTMSILQNKRRGDHVFYYFTSHALPPLSQSIKTTTDADTKASRKQILAERPWADQFFIGFEMNVAASRVSETWDHIRESSPSAAMPEDSFMTPQTLRGILSEAPDDVDKTVVLQGCYTGGFLGAPGRDNPEDRLSSLSQMTVMTASAYDRPSFGCNPGANRTYFGDAFIQSLEAHPGNLDTLNWSDVYKDTQKRVGKREQQMGFVGKKSSLPQFFSNRS